MKTCRERVIISQETIVRFTAFLEGPIGPHWQLTGRIVSNGRHQYALECGPLLKFDITKKSLALQPGVFLRRSVADPLLITLQNHGSFNHTPYLFLGITLPFTARSLVRDTNDSFLQRTGVGQLVGNTVHADFKGIPFR